jgi:phage terminase large subunit-like protein
MNSNLAAEIKKARDQRDVDFVAIAIAYAQEAIDDKKREKHGVLMRQAAQRFVKDLKRAQSKSPPFIFDAWHANDACAFIECLPHVEGTWESPTIVMHPSHIFFVVQLFGFRKLQGMHVEGWQGLYHPRRFTSALFAVARKNAKSLLSSSIMNYCQSCEPEPGAQLYSAATTYSQAEIIFKASKRQVEMTKDLREEFGLETWAKAITREAVGSTYKPIHAKASTQDGLNPSHVALDEIHAHKNGDLLNVLKSAAGARDNPLFLYTTTEGYTNPGPWGELRPFVQRLLAGVFGDDMDHFLVVFFKIDDADKNNKIKEDNPFDSKVWIKANPLMDVNPKLAEAIRTEALEAMQMPSKMAEFLIKRVNRAASTGGGWIDLNKWSKCGGAVDLEWLKQFPCYGGLDLASTGDLTSFRLVWLVDGMLYTYAWRWVPESAVQRRKDAGTVNYAGWVQGGYLLVTEGDVTDYAVIERCVLDACSNFDVQNIAFDRWNASDLVNRLVEAGVPMVEFIQGFKSYHPAMQALERYYISGKLAHGGDPLLNWNASNLIARRDDNLNMAPDKKKSPDKIDDACSLLMAIGVLMADQEETLKPWDVLTA